MSVICAIISAAISAGIMALPLWNTKIIFIVSVGVLLGLLIMCMPANGMSNSIFGLTFLSFLACCFIFILIVSVIKYFLLLH
jgi:hypothetical protein